MILIVYGKEKEIFTSSQYAVSDAIVELYQYVQGSLDDDLFSMAIDGMVRTANISDMVRMFNAMACEKPIHTIYTQAQEYWRPNDAD
jgi:hypothetical protein